MDNTAAYTEITAARENMYLFLANLYKTEVTEDFYRQIKDADLSAQMQGGLFEGYSKIKKFCDTDRHDPITDLAVDYARVFLGAGVVETEQSAFPYESVYTSEKRLIMQEARDEVLALYRKYGLGVDDRYNIPEDHIALELEFMGYLCRLINSYAAAEDADEAVKILQEQEGFIKLHFDRWVPAFCKDIKKVSGTDFYSGAADLTLSFIAMDKEIIDEQLNSFKPQKMNQG